MNLKGMETIDLLRLQASVIDELKSREVVRTSNNPLGDYTEWLVAKALKLELESNSKAGYDGVSKKGGRYQIKGRRVTPTNNSRQLSSIRKLEDKPFDYIAAIIYDENFDALEARLIPHEVVLEYAKYVKHVNGHKLIMKGPIMIDKRVKCFKHKLED